MEIRSESWVALGDSIVGTSHVARGVPCQDHHAGASLGKGFILAVADGAGSVACAEEGSATAVDRVVTFFIRHEPIEEALSESDWKKLFEELLSDVKASIEAQARQVHGRQSGDYATTLLLAVATETQLVTFQVGDGAIVLRHSEGMLQTLQAGATPGEYVNETTFVTSSRALEEAVLNVFSTDTVSAIALLTDGVQFAAIGKGANEPHGPFFNPIFAFAAKDSARSADLSGLLQAEWLSDLTDDDKTLVVAVRSLLTEAV